VQTYGLALISISELAPFYGRIRQVGLGLFFLIHALCFIAIDVLLFNVGQVFEMFISLVAVMAALDMLKVELTA